MKMTQAYKKAQENMAAGVLTADGFLGHDTRPISDIIESDEEHMNKIGLSFETLVEKMTYLLEKGKAGLGEPVSVDGTWLVRVDETRGTLPSPWEDGIFHKLNCEVTLGKDFRDSKNTLIYNELCLHLISKYHFFQGKGSPFRLEPEKAKEILKL